MILARRVHLKLTIEQDLENTEVEITIKCGIIDHELEQLISQIRLYSFSIIGTKDGVTSTIPIENILYFDSVDDKTFVYLKDNIFESELKLYEIEEKLSKTSFTRISKSCVLNTKTVSRVKSLLNGKYEVELINKEKVIVNRHYLKSFKEKFGL